mmetsp:Transcript_16797/g.25081  ORF Transcript_16797/g.25081 Transcript_16797/m.25081 type:complete len:137 (-) Transcript_16797:50-460(-)
MSFGGAPKCPKCKKSVYAAERVRATAADWHKVCLACFSCNKRLDSTTLCERPDKSVYCKSCYAKNFGPSGFRGGNAGGVVSTEAPTSTRTTTASPQAATRSTASTTSTGSYPKFCPSCGTGTGGGKFCSNCGNQLK